MHYKVFNLHKCVIFLRGYTHAGLWFLVLFKELDVDLRVGEIELRVGSKIMIHFLYILLFFIWHMYLYIIHC